MDLKDKRFDVDTQENLDSLYGKGTLGGFFEDSGRIVVSSSTGRGTAIHELQHAVDSLQKRDMGANPGKVWSDITAIYEDLPVESKEVLNLLNAKEVL